MLRYFCIISLLIFIQQTFCYDYVYEDSYIRGDYRPLSRKLRPRNHRYGGNDDVKRKFHRDFPAEIDRNPTGKFDLAGFLEKPDEDAVQDYSLENKDSSQQSKESNNYNLLPDVSNEDIKKREKSQDYFNVGADNTPDLNLGSPLYKDLMNPRHSNLNTLSLDDMNSARIVQNREDKLPKSMYRSDLLADKSPSHHTEKKCSYKNIKFPFFSRNKSDPAKTKNNKKRKMFCVNCPKKHVNETQKQSDAYKVSDKVDDDAKLSKRSYEEKLCPACKKKFIANVNRRSVSKRRLFNGRKMFHNSRQAMKLKAIDNEKYSKGSPESSGQSENVYKVKRIRKKRDDNKESKDKQLQGVEKRVDTTEMVPVISKTN